ncbi:putative disease resistance protein RGA3 [Salvia hispanica]|uniref:putative disease resistance protein RGA3 n=1 Tax=Salvia hispanica TaxID=49212 RepID=UPI002009C10B|nr:putative disease resistance protein RGA3 [Salvia hispanica]
MEGEAVAAVIKVLVQNLIDHSKKEISLVRGLEKDAAKLAGSLDTIQQLLNDAESRTIPGGAVKSWLRKLEDVAFDADNVLDELNYHLLSKQIKSIKPMKEKLLKSKKSNENLEYIRKEGAELGLKERLANDVPKLPHAAFETDSFSHDPIFIGRDELVSEIVEVINTRITTDERIISIIAIVGMGGLGQTTLTRNVFHHPKIKTHFGSHIWVHVSQIFDSITLFKKILKCLISTDKVEVESRADIMKKLLEALKDKIYLLILDDIWNQDRPKWDDFINSLVGVTSTKRNAIVITTRNMEVASTVQSLHTHELKGLSHEDCWSIIKAKTFGKVDIPLEFEAIGRKIATRWQGSSNNTEGGSRVRYMIHDEESRITKEVAKYLRTLLFEGHIYRNKFVDFERLHTLVLADDWCTKLPSSIRKLIHLRKLDISSTSINYLPDWNWIGELHQMQTINANLRGLELPSALKYLINLRHLYIDSFAKLPAEIGSLTSLQTLEYFRVGDKNGWKIKEIGSLNDLKGKLKIFSLEKVENKEEAEKASQSNKSKLLKLHLSWNMYGGGDTPNDKNVLEGLQPHSNLKKLAIEGFNGKKFPSWTQKMAVENVPQGCWVPLNKLIEIKLYECSKCEEIPMFGHLPNLKSLWLEGLTNLKFINSSFYGLVNEETHIVFLALEKLVLHNMPNLAEWAEVESPCATDVTVFPNLQHLQISWCKQLTSFPNQSESCLKSLVVRETGSMPLTCIFKTKLKLLIELCIERIYGLEYLPNWLFYNNPNLLELTIRRCSNLRELPDGLGTLNSLEMLSISDCPNLERIANIGAQHSQGSLTCLQRMKIYECEALLYFPWEMVGSLLEVLEFENLS